MMRSLRLGFATTAVALWATGCAADAPLGSRADNNTSSGGGSSTDPEGSGGVTPDAGVPRGSGGVAQGGAVGSGGVMQGETPRAGGAGSGAQPGNGAGGSCICTAIGCGIGTHSVMVPGQCCPVCESCENVPCDLKGCADGTEPVTLPGECCPSMCAPIANPRACNDGSGRTDCCPQGFDLGVPCAVEDASCLTPCKNGVRTRRICMTVWRQGEEVACEP